MPRAPLLVGAVAAGDWGVKSVSCCWSQTPPTSLRDATAPNRGGLGKEDRLYAMPRAPLLVGAVAAGDWGVKSVSCCWSQTPPTSLRDATAPNRGGLGKEDRLYAMPRAPLLVGAVAAGDWGVKSVSCCWSQTPPSSLRDATAPSRGGLGKKAGFYAMPRAPLLGGLARGA